MKSHEGSKKRGVLDDELEELDDDIPTHRPRVERDERDEYEEWRKERGGRGRKRRGHREREHHRREEDDL